MYDQLGICNSLKDINKLLSTRKQNENVISAGKFFVSLNADNKSINQIFCDINIKALISPFKITPIIIDNEFSRPLSIYNQVETSHIDYKNHGPLSRFHSILKNLKTRDGLCLNNLFDVLFFHEWEKLDENTAKVENIIIKLVYNNINKIHEVVIDQTVYPTISGWKYKKIENDYINKKTNIASFKSELNFNIDILKEYIFSKDFIKILYHRQNAFKLLKKLNHVDSKRLVRKIYDKSKGENKFSYSSVSFLDGIEYSSQISEHHALETLEFFEF